MKNALDHHMHRRLPQRVAGGVRDRPLSRGRRQLSAKQTLKVSEVLEHYATLPKINNVHEDWEDEP